MDITEYIDRQISEYCKQYWTYNDDTSDIPFDLKEFRNCFIMQLIKNAYDETEPKKSLRHFRENDTDSARMQDSRNMAYAQHYRTLQYNDILQSTGINARGLLPEDFTSMKGRIAGHKKTAMQYFELQTMEKYPIFKAIVSKRISDVKKVPNTVFKEYMSDYEELIQELLKGLEGDAETVIFSAIALFTLEWKYNIELFYTCALCAEKYGIKDIPRKKITHLCGWLSMPMPTNYMNILHIESRFVLHRNKLVPYIYNGADWDRIQEKLYNYLVMNYVFDNEMFHHDSLVEYYAKSSTREEWAEFIRLNYNLKNLYKPKEWTNKRIRYMRRLNEALIKSQPTPKS